MVTGSTNNKIGINVSTVRATATRYSEFVDRVNAHRFKTMVGPDGFGRVNQPKFGIPFSLDRPEAAAAHRELEHQLKPAARSARKMFSPHSQSVKVLSAGVRASQLFIAFAGFCGLVCAYAIQRSFR